MVKNFFLKVIDFVSEILILLKCGFARWQNETQICINLARECSLECFFVAKMVPCGGLKNFHQKEVFQRICRRRGVQPSDQQFCSRRDMLRELNPYVLR